MEGAIVTTKGYLFQTFKGETEDRRDCAINEFFLKNKDKDPKVLQMNSYVELYPENNEGYSSCQFYTSILFELSSPSRGLETNTDMPAYGLNRREKINLLNYLKSTTQYRNMLTNWSVNEKIALEQAEPKLDKHLLERLKDGMRFIFK